MQWREYEMGMESWKIIIADDSMECWGLFWTLDPSALQNSGGLS